LETNGFFGEPVVREYVFDILPNEFGIPKTRLRFLLLSIAGLSQLPFNLMAIRSYVRSFLSTLLPLRVRRLPTEETSFSTDSLSTASPAAECYAALIAVVMGAAFRAIPFTDAQWQFGQNVTTVPSVYYWGTNGQSSPAFDHTTGICNQAGNSPWHQKYSEPTCGFHHVLYCQINHDGLVLTHQLSCQFMEKSLRLSAILPNLSHLSLALLRLFDPFHGQELLNLSQFFCAET